MTNTTIPLDKVQSKIAQINLSPQLEELLKEFSEWCSYQQEDWEVYFLEEILGTELETFYKFLYQNNISIRPSGFEFYLIEEDSESTEESEQSNCLEVVGQK